MTDPKPPHDVDALARRVPRREPVAERSLAMRDAIFDAAQGQGQPAPSARGWWIGMAAAAAAACVGAWLMLRGPGRPTPGPPAAGAVATAPAAPSSLSPSRLASPPIAHPARAAVVTAVADGHIPDGVTTFATTSPLYMTRGDAAITAPPAARFDVEVRDDQVKRVTVIEGWVVVAGAHASTTIVPMRYMWTPEAPAPEPVPPQPAPAAPVTTADADRSAPPPRGRPSVAASPAARSPASSYDAPPASAGSATALRTGSAAHSAAAGSSAPSTEPVPGPASAPPPARLPAAAERDFRDGLRTLLAGDPTGATAALDRACDARSNSQDDGCYWAAVAWLRSGDHNRARRGFSEMLTRWPGSTHVGEANVALGWLLLAVGDTTGARTRFAAAADDRVPSVRASAIRGLAATQ